MKFSTATLIATAAMGATAAPSRHGHGHQHAHRSLENRAVVVEEYVTVVEYVKAVRPEPVPTTLAAPPPPPPAPTTSEEPKVSVAAVPAPQPKPKPKPSSSKPQPSQAPSPGGEGQGPSTYTPFCGGKKIKRATAAEIAYAGNLGIPGDYGCNMMLIKSNIASEYKYTAKIMNAGNKEQKCTTYLKIGPTGLIDGFFKGKEPFTFNIPPKGTQYLAIDANTQGGVICQAGSIETDQYGGWASTWAEFDFANESNNGWSGADASSLAASRAGLSIPGLQICAAGQPCSTIYPGGKGTNAFTAGMEAEDGHGLNIPAQAKVHLDITVDFQG